MDSTKKLIDCIGCGHIWEKEIIVIEEVSFEIKDNYITIEKNMNDTYV